METAITKLISYFEQQLSLQRSNEIKCTTEEALVDAIGICKNAKDSYEKEQIIEAFNSGAFAQYTNPNKEHEGIIYFTNTFTNQIKQ